MNDQFDGNHPYIAYESLITKVRIGSLTYAPTFHHLGQYDSLIMTQNGLNLLPIIQCQICR